MLTRSRPFAVGSYSLTRAHLGGGANVCNGSNGDSMRPIGNGLESKCDPGENPQHIVVGCVGTRVIEIVPATVELAVERVLNANAGIHQRPHRPLAVRPQRIVDLAHEAVAVWSSAPVEDVFVAR